MMNTKKIGSNGEDKACSHLAENGYTILRRNYRASRGEIDIIAKKETLLAFIEVKTRRNTQFGLASDAVNFKKQQRIKSAAKVFIMSYNDYDRISFDVCEVYTEEKRINYIENAF